ncbi:MAG: 1-acyl-sn-glycerol-3-phosphate acyltransferase [Sedimentisphaerales bacterium]|nr:1-acyl-sn-glycerol-3-phosphate acyltransferase [Sedimentisphaerales bacterium]
MLKEYIRIAWYKIACVILRIFCAICFRLRIFGKANIPKKGAFIIASNHQSYMDPVLCGACLFRPMYYLARESLFKNWFFAAIIRSLGAMPIRQKEGDIATFRHIIALLKQGKGVCLFPEGTRTSDGKIDALKPGLGLLATRGRASIVPTVIDGAFEAWPRQKRIFSLGSIWLQYGRPITHQQAKEMGNEKLAQHLTAELRKMQNELRAKRAKEQYTY